MDSITNVERFLQKSDCCNRISDGFLTKLWRNSVTNVTTMPEFRHNLWRIPSQDVGQNLPHTWIQVVELDNFDGIFRHKSKFSSQMSSQFFCDRYFLSQTIVMGGFSSQIFHGNCVGPVTIEFVYQWNCDGSFFVTIFEFPSQLLIFFVTNSVAIGSFSCSVTTHCLISLHLQRGQQAIKRRVFMTKQHYKGNIMTIKVLK